MVHAVRYIPSLHTTPLNATTTGHATITALSTNQLVGNVSETRTLPRIHYVSVNNARSLV
ncbi:hypothetical protein VPH159E362A_0061 [Vibrio phage 159E36-2a]|nr:hypothetical protein VP142E351_P0063 [Vibrio phage 142E35-1]